MRQISTIITSNRREYIVKNLSGFRYVKLVQWNESPKLSARPSLVSPWRRGQKREVQKISNTLRPRPYE